MASRIQTDYQKDQERCTLFLLNYYNKRDKGRKYADMLQKIANRQSRVLKIEWDDINEHYGKQATADESLATFLGDILENTKRYLHIFAEAADSVMPEPDVETLDVDVFDILSEQRKAQEEKNQQTALPNAPNPLGPASKPSGLPPSLLRRFDTYILPPGGQESMKLRSISSGCVGKLVKVKGIVTQVTDVKPLASVVTYTDEATGNEVYQEVVGRTFMPLDAKQTGKASSESWMMQTRGSKFTKFQEARIQEMADEVPQGSTPRTMSIHLKGEITRSLKAGDEVVLAGIFLPEPFTGFRAMRAGLLTSTFLEVMNVEQVRTSYSQYVVTDEQQQKIQEVLDKGDVYSKLARSIAPEIWGHHDVKKALLLQMVGGVTRDFQDGMKLRGDIHICLMGDPGVAKSQLLKHVAKLAPRAVYTTGKGSSGVGLTAAVLRNQVTKELVLEGGALVLADRGICCIDEFDKMDESDRTAIHEVMEQQTVSIAKAGITTTLNTRTTILAAANPSWGRWDKRRSVGDNINLPAALLSRFDLLWLILDRADPETDAMLADHVLHVHMCGGLPQSEAQNVVPPELLRAYIAMAKRIEPHIPESLTDYICTHYVDMRQKEEEEGQAAGNYTTPRTLMSILRLSQAVAKLRFDTQVQQSDVDEAIRLMLMSKISISSDETTATRREDPVSTVYRLVRQYALTHNQPQVPYDKIMDLVQRMPYITRDIVLQAVKEYENISVWGVIWDDQGNPTVDFYDADV